MRFGVVKLAEVATHKFSALLADILELGFFATAMHNIEDVVVIIGIDYLSHIPTLPYGFLKSLPESGF